MIVLLLVLQGAQFASKWVRFAVIHSQVLDTTMWEVTFVDGTIQDYSTNVIAESLYFYLNVNKYKNWFISPKIVSLILNKSELDIVCRALLSFNLTK